MSELVVFLYMAFALFNKLAYLLEFKNGMISCFNFSLSALVIMHFFCYLKFDALELEL